MKKLLDSKQNLYGLKLCILKKFWSLIDLIISSKILTRIIFKIDILPYKHSNCQNWDFTTLILKKALNKFIKNNQNILEVGTGHLAILSIYIAKKKNINITAIDINPIFIENAKRNQEKNNVVINFVQSDLFSNVDDLFDIVFFNPPYVSKEWVLKNRKDLYTNSIFDLVWNGGIDGDNIIRRFLNEVSKVIHINSWILLGINVYFIDLLRMKKLIQENNLELVSIISSFWIPSKALLLRKKGY